MTNLLRNASFEDSPGTGLGVTPAEWTTFISTEVGGTFNVSSVDINRFGNATATDGTQYISSFTEGIQQVLTTPLDAGVTYELSFDANFFRESEFGIYDQLGNVLFDAALTLGPGDSLAVVDEGGANRYTIQFTPTVAVTTLKLLPGGASQLQPGSEGVTLLDNLFLLALCFTRGTLIRTRTGERSIEDLTAGDMVLTMDHGYQPIRWIGSSKRPATGALAPILIRKGALGNTRDLRVSPQHRMLLSGWQAEVLFGESEVLATAKSLVNDHSILREEGDEVEYFHMLFDTHEIVYAEGAPSESFHPGAEGWKALDAPTRNEILELFPQLAKGDFDSYGPSARASLKHKEGSLLSHSMISQTQH